MKAIKPETSFFTAATWSFTLSTVVILLWPLSNSPVLGSLLPSVKSTLIFSVFENSLSLLTLDNASKTSSVVTLWRVELSFLRAVVSVPKPSCGARTKFNPLLIFNNFL